METNKELLLKDLCARLPYGVVIQEKCLEYDKMFLPNEENNSLINIDICNGTLTTNGGSFYSVDEVKPYLFPLSSMTEEQRQEFLSVAGYERREEDCGRHTETYYYDMVGHENALYPNCDAIDWLNAHHFDYRGLIPMCLALEAPEGMYNIKTE